MTGAANIREKTLALAEQGSLPRSSCSKSFLHFLRPLLDSGVLSDEKNGAGRRIKVVNPERLKSFIHDRFPTATTVPNAPSRIAGVAQFRNSKSLLSDTSEIVNLRSWSQNALTISGSHTQAADATRMHGLFSFLLDPDRPYSLNGVCALVENPAVFTHIEHLKLGIDLAIYYHGRVTNRLLNWLKESHTKDCRFLHLPDYDPVGLTEYIRLRNQLGDRLQLHLPKDLAERFAKFSDASILRKTKNLATLKHVRESPLHEVQKVVKHIDRHNAVLEQEALFLDIEFSSR